jgi:hypothetical protein
VLPGPEIFFRPVHGKSSAKSGKSPANLHIKRKTAFSRRVNKIVNKFFSLSLSVRHYSKRRKFFQNISSATFLPLLTKFGHNSAINSSGQIFFSPAPFELFGRNFGHLATLVEPSAQFEMPAASVAAVQGGFIPRASKSSSHPGKCRCRGGHKKAASSSLNAAAAIYTPPPAALARQSAGLCFFHWSFGDKADKCGGICSWQGN